MTVCVASLSSDGACIVCVADKALGYSDYIQWDSDASKIIPLWNNKIVALTSSGKEAHLSRLMAKLESRSPQSYERAEIWRHLESQFQECLRESQEIEILRPVGLTFPDYLDAIRGASRDSVIGDVSADMSKFVYDCDVILCGFDFGRMPFIFHLEPPGKITDYTNIGFHANGSGMEKAVSELLFIEHKRSNGVARTLYECFDAKAHAEMAVGVGYEWDSYLVTGGGAKPVKEAMKPLIDQAWAKFNRSPFEERKEDDLPEPPDDWYMQMKKIIAESLGEGFKD